MSLLKLVSENAVERHEELVDSRLRVRTDVEGHDSPVSLQIVDRAHMRIYDITDIHVITRLHSIAIDCRLLAALHHVTKDCYHTGLTVWILSRAIHIRIAKDDVLNSVN